MSSTKCLHGNDIQLVLKRGTVTMAGKHTYAALTTKSVIGSNNSTAVHTLHVSMRLVPICNF